MDIKIMLLVSACAFACVVAPARPAYKGTVSLVQPDGKTVMAKVIGDEFFHYTKDMGGHTLAQDETGFWCYSRFNPDGTQTCTEFKAGEPAPGYILAASANIPQMSVDFASNQARRRMALRDALNGKGKSLMQRLSEGEPAPAAVMPHRKGIVVIAQTSDVKMKHTRQDFQAMLNRKNYTPEGSYGATGSVVDYFNYQFQGKTTFEFDVSEIVTVSRNMSYYFANNNGSDVRPEQFVKEACELASRAGTDFSQYDNDGDGEADNVFVIVAGENEAEGGPANTLWPHQWYLKDGGGIVLSLNNTIVNNYAMSTELGHDLNSGQWVFTQIGVFCHEYGHAMGLPDLYDTDGEDSGGETVGLYHDLNVMDGGSYNNSSNTPAGYTALDRDLLGIGNPKAFTSGTLTLEPINESNAYYKLKTDNPGEYFLFECRDNSLWDRYIGGKGMLVYHIDASQNNSGQSTWQGRSVTAAERWQSNEINNNPDHMCVRLIVPRATFNGFGGPSLFFPYGNKSSLGPKTSPALLPWNGKDPGISISGIVAEGNNIKFTVYGDGTGYPDVKEFTYESFQDAVILKWKASEPYSGKATAVVSDASGDNEKRLSVSATDGTYYCLLDNLTPNTSYNVKVTFRPEFREDDLKTHVMTQDIYEEGFAYIYLNNVPGYWAGTLPAGTPLPLRVFNAKDHVGVTWYFNGSEVEPGPTGYWDITGSGTLKAVVKYSDGAVETIVKELETN